MSIQRWLNHSCGVHVASSALAMLAALCWASSATAGLIVNDTWKDGDRNAPASPTYSENGTDSDADTDLESAWFRGGGGTFDPVGAGGPLRGSGFGTSSASWTTYFTPEASPVTLAQAGDLIRLTWVFTTGNVNATNASQNFRLALIDTVAAARLITNGSPSGTATGYAIFGNMGETFGHATPFQLRARTGQSAILSASGDWGTNLANGGTNGNSGYTDNTQYTLVWTITRNASGNLDIVAKMSGGTLDAGAGSVTATSLNTAPNGGAYTFDTFTLRPSNEASTSTVFDTSLFRVEFIPEPASLALMGLGGLAVLGLRRRRR